MTLSAYACGSGPGYDAPDASAYVDADPGLRDAAEPVPLDGATVRADQHAEPKADAASPSSGAGGEGPTVTDAAAAAQPDARPSPYCGDGIRDPLEEECDDGPEEGDDLCASDCTVRDGYVVETGSSPAPGEPIRRLGNGPHVAAASADAMVVLFLEQATTTTVMAQWFGSSGHRIGMPAEVSTGTLPIVEADPVAAPISGGQFAVAWIEHSRGTPDVVVARIAPDGSVATSRLVHEMRAGLQDGPDMVWVAGELVVAWTSDLDVWWRRFDGQLRPVVAETPLSATDALESDVSLGVWSGAPVAAWRSGLQGLQRIHVRAGIDEWVSPEHLPGPPGDRPAMLELDSDHLLLAYTVGTDPNGVGAATVGKLRVSVVQRSSHSELTAVVVHPLTEEYDDSSLEQRRPSLARADDTILLTYEAAGPETSDQGRKTLVQVLSWSDDAPGTLTQIEERLLQRNALTPGDQINPRAVPTPLAPTGALLAIWEHHRHDLLDRPDPDVLVALRPLPLLEHPR